MSAPGSPEYVMTRCGPSVLVLSSSDFIFTIDLAAVVSDASSTYPLPVSANEQSMLSYSRNIVVDVVVWEQGR